MRHDEASQLDFRIYGSESQASSPRLRPLCIRSNHIPSQPVKICQDLSRIALHQPQLGWQPRGPDGARPSAWSIMKPHFNILIYFDMGWWNCSQPKHKRFSRACAVAPAQTLTFAVPVSKHQQSKMRERHRKTPQNDLNQQLWNEIGEKGDANTRPREKSGMISGSLKVCSSH
jgi:hypothetical protein